MNDLKKENKTKNKKNKNKNIKNPGDQNYDQNLNPQN